MQLSNLQWGGTIQSFCIANTLFNVDIRIVDNVMFNINNVIGQTILMQTPICRDGDNTILFGPTDSGAAATTTYNMEKGYISNTTVTLDVRMVQTQALAQRCLLHEFLHVLTLRHNTEYDSIMSLRIVLTSTMEVIQKVDYKPLSHNDCLRIQRIYNVNHQCPSYVFPRRRPWSHVSGTKNYKVPESIPRILRPNGSKLDYWIKRLHVH